MRQVAVDGMSFTAIFSKSTVSSCFADVPFKIKQVVDIKLRGGELYSLNAPV